MEQPALARRFSAAEEIFFRLLSETLNSQQVSDTKIFSNALIFFLMRGKLVNLARTKFQEPNSKRQIPSAKFFV
jgi:hypothetical protein